MSEKITNVELQDFLSDFEINSETIILEEGKERNEILAIAKARGIDLRNNRSLAGFKTIYTFTQKQNNNGAILPKKKFLKALPGIIGKPVNIDHIRKYVIGHYIDYRYLQKEDMAIAYGVFYKANFADEWKQAKQLFQNKKLTTSYEIWCPKTKRRFYSDGTYELTEQEIAGGALIFREKPAFEDAHVLEMAKSRMDRQYEEGELVFASTNPKYLDEDLIISDTSYFRKAVEDNAKRLAEEKKAKVEAQKPEQAVEPKKEEPKPEEKKEPIKEEPKTNMIKCSNCHTEIEYNGIDVQVKCPNCFAILNKEGVMQYPPQIKDFKVLCPSCNVNNWLILNMKPEDATVKCQSCAKEYKIEFEIASVDVQKLLDKFNFLYNGSVMCPQCQSRIPIYGASQLKERIVECPKCKMKFEFDITHEKYRKVRKIEEIQKVDNPEKSSEKGGHEMDLEISKFHRAVEDFEALEKSIVDIDTFDLELAKTEKAKVLTTEQRNALPDNMFAVMIRVKNKRTGKIRKIRMYPIHDEAHVRNALARLGQEQPKATLKRLGANIEKVRAKILRRARQLKMEDLLKRQEKASKKTEPVEAKEGKVICECLECGHKLETDEHCNTVKCPKCGKDMRRADRPGKGQPVKSKEELVKASEEQKDEKPLDMQYEEEIETSEPKDAIELAKYKGIVCGQKTLIKEAVGRILKAKKERGLVVASSTEKATLLKGGIKKVVNQLIETRAKLADLETAMQKKIDFYKDNAKKIYDRKQELGDFAEGMTDEQLVDDKELEIARLKKQVAEKETDTSHIETANENVGHKDTRRDTDYYKNVQKQINDRAFPESKK